jgi:hypothetical protein
MDQKKSKTSSKRAPSKSKGPRIIDFDNPPPPLLETELPPEEQAVDMASFAKQSINKMNEKSINFNDEIEKSAKKINFSKKVNKIKDSEMKDL